MKEASGEPRRCILVVDDEPATAKLLRAWCADGPFVIREAHDGHEGLALVRSEKPDLILLDVMMPGIDGIELTRRLKSDAATKTIPIILLSARKDVETKVLAFDSGADDYVTKPFELHEVDARVRAMLRKRDLYLEVEELSIVDDKTGLANYRQFRRKLQEEWLRAERYQTPLSLVMLDLDDFKILNDALGHPAGDRALREFATLVAGGARATDLAARFGGEEFAVILPHTDSSMAARVAERILAAVRDHVFLSDTDPSRLTASAGVAMFPSEVPVDSAEALVTAADRALYRAKTRGKDRVVILTGADELDTAPPRGGRGSGKIPGSGPSSGR